MVSNNPTSSPSVLATDRGMADPRYVEGTGVYRPVVHPHWGSIFAGIFVALSALAVLSALGIAIGVSAYDPNSTTARDARMWGVGAGIWAVVSSLIAFAVGGYVAARTSTYHSQKKGTFHGMMVWAVSIPLLALLVGGGLSGLAMGAADSNMVPNVAMRDTAGGSVTAGGRSVTLNGGMDNGNGNVINANDAKSVASKAAWGVLASLLLGLGAATLGGYMGGKSKRGNTVEGTA